jgi:hypothetical protein
MAKNGKYPESVKLGQDVNDYGKERVYRVTREDATKIAKEFPKSFRFKPPFAPETEGEQLFYMNVNHGAQHIIFAVRKP